MNTHVAQIYESFINGSTTFSFLDGKLHIVMEYFAGGSLLDLIKKKGPLHESHIAVVMKQVVKAVHFLHQKRKFHRGIKGKEPS